MRALVLCIALPFLAACGDSGTSTDSGIDATANDLGAADLGTPVDANVDMPPRPQTCLQVITCASGCAGRAACEAACVTSGSATAQAQYAALFACAYGFCLTDADGSVADGGAGPGPGPIDAGAPDSGVVDAGADDASVSDAGGGPLLCTSTDDTSAGCQMCVSMAAQGPGCTTELTACLTGT